MLIPNPDIAKKNLVLLHQYHPETAKGLLEYLQKQRERGEPPRYWLEATASGSPILVTIYENRRIILQDSQSPQSVSPSLVSELTQSQLSAVAIWSCGLGNILQVLQPLCGKCKLIVIEPEYDIFSASLEITSWENWPAYPHLLLFIGPEAEIQFREFFTRYRSWRQNGWKMFPGRMLLEAEKKRYAELQESLKTENQRVAHPIPIAVSESGNDIAVLSTEAHRDLLPILQAEGEILNLQVRTICHSAPLIRFLQSRDFWWETLGLPLPRTILTFSEAVFSHVDWEKLHAQGIQRILWLYDDPFRRPLYESFFQHLDRIYCYDPILTDQLRKISPIPVQYLPGATSFGNGFPFSDTDAEIPAWLRERPLDCTFVGSTGLQRFDDPVIQMVSHNTGAYYKINTWVQERLNQGEIISYEDLLSLPIQLPGWESSAKTMFIEDSATFIIRKHFLSALPSERLTLFGDRGWSEPALAGSLCRSYVGQSLDYLSETPWVYHRSKINLNLFNVQCVNSPNVRLFDIMACGGFVLTEYRPIIDQLFYVGKELEVFRTREELADKVEYYLTHEESRQKIAQAGCRRILREHRYRDRLKKIPLKKVGN